MNVHGYTDLGSIAVTIGDVYMTVPDDMANGRRRQIAEWEAQGNTIPPYDPLPTFADRQAAKQQAVRDKRWTVETAGTTAMGIGIRTDEVGQAKLTGALALFDNDPTVVTVDWEATPGVWVTLDGPTVAGLGVIVGRHIQACFSHARILSEAIAGAVDDAALAAIDIDTGWPE